LRDRTADPAQRACPAHVPHRFAVRAAVRLDPPDPPAAMLSVPPSRPISRSPSSLQEVVHPPEEVKEEEGKSLGVKSIGTFLSFIFVINQVRAQCDTAAASDCMPAARSVRSAAERLRG